MALQLLGEAALSAFFENLFQALSSIFHKGFFHKGLGLIWGVNQEQLGRIKHYLSRIQGLLNDAERRRTKDVGVSHWLDDLRELAYDMEDIIEEMNTEHIEKEVHAKKLLENELQASGFFSRKKPKLGVFKFNKEIKSKIEEAIKKFSELAERADALGLRREVLEGTSKRRRQTGLLADRPEVYMAETKIKKM